MTALRPPCRGHSHQLAKILMLEQDALRPLSCARLGGAPSGKNHYDRGIQRNEASHSFAPVFFAFGQQFLHAVDREADREATSMIAIDLRKVDVTPPLKIENVQI